MESLRGSQTHNGTLIIEQRNTNILFVLQNQKRPESPLDPTNPFLEDEAGEDVGTDKDEDLAKVS